ncbi:MAG: SDR family NAD(P)-dependent oxidoreductase [Chitinophagaceae bacterium]
MHKAALITGSSEGLGKAFAFELAGRGVDLVLVSLPGSGLPGLAAFIIKNYSIQVSYFEMDLTQTDNCVQLFNSLKEKRMLIHILINNAGIGNWSWFEEERLEFYKKQIELNVLTPVLLTKLFLEQVNKTEKKYLLNVGSLGGLFIIPKKQVYGATKSFIRYFTKCLRMELSHTNVSVSLLSPGGISTKPELLVLNHELKGISRYSILEPDSMAKIAIEDMLNGKKEIIPGLTNKLMVYISTVLPNYIIECIMQKQTKKISTNSFFK